MTANPLRYPGSKRALAPYIEGVLLRNNLQGCCFLEPYAGSAAAGIALLRRNTIGSLVLCEKDVLLYAFWKCVFEHTSALCQKIADTPVTVEKWKSLLPYRDEKSATEKNILNLGFAGLFFNRTAFSGILNAYPIGGFGQTSSYTVSCRFNKEKIREAVRTIGSYRERVTVHHDDALAFTTEQQKRFLGIKQFIYFDPPYYEQGKRIYRHYYNEADHENLSRFIKTLHQNWLLSYDDVPAIRRLYNGVHRRRASLHYSCKNHAAGKELLFSNLPLPPFKSKR